MLMFLIVPLFSYVALTYSESMSSGEKLLYAIELLDHTTNNSAGELNVTPVDGPTPRFGQSMAYDTSTNQTILFGGVDANGSFQSDTWEWTGDNWVELHPKTSPSPRVFAAVATANT